MDPKTNLLKAVDEYNYPRYTEGWTDSGTLQVEGQSDACRLGRERCGLLQQLLLPASAL
jgi:hypothetical protein